MNRIDAAFEKMAATLPADGAAYLVRWRSSLGGPLATYRGPYGCWTVHPEQAVRMTRAEAQAIADEINREPSDYPGLAEVILAEEPIALVKTPAVNVLALVRGEQHYVFLFSDLHRRDVLRAFERFAADPQLSFTWHDAVELSGRVDKNDFPTWDGWKQP